MLPKFSAIYAGLLVLALASAAPRRGRGRPPSHQIASSRYGQRLEAKLRLGLDKSGITDWNVNSGLLAGLRLRDPTPVEIAAPRPQLNGNMGDPAAPRRLSRRKQFQPAAYTSPRRGIRSPPAALTTLTDREMLAVATEFWVKYNYTSNQLTAKEDLTAEMQRNYGLPVTGVLDEATVTAMLKPRCGYPDKPAEYNLFENREHWQNKDVTYTITGYTPDMSQCQIRNTFKKAFRVWEEVTDLTFEMVDRKDADIIIYFGYEEHGDGYPFDGSNGLLAHAFTPGTTAISGDAHFDEGEFWTLGNGKVFDTYNGNSGGDACVFPFYFEKKSYSACTTAGRSDGIEWCATTDDFDQDGKWAFCPHELLFTYGGNAESDPCVFPYVFLGDTYDSCTYEGRSDGYSWCSTTPNFDDDGRWGFCPSRAHGTSGGNAGGASCSFPFIFESNSYDDCTTQGRNDYMLWCSTTPNYDTDRKFGFCNGKGYSLFLVAAHEFGHAIGLDHSSAGAALMYPTYSYTQDFQLPSDDIRGAQDLYGGPRRRALPPLRLEKCGGDLTTTETATTRRPATTQPRTTRRTTTTRRTRRTRPTPTPPPSPRPTSTLGGTFDRCDDSVAPTSICQNINSIDAVMLYQSQQFVFQGSWVWIVSGRGKSQQQQVARVTSYWPVLKCGVDGAYQRPHDSKLMFFKGSRYYLFDGSRIEAGYPKDVTTLKLPYRTVVDDVVFMKTRNPRTRVKGTRLYYFVGDTVYRANPETGIVVNAEPSTLGVTRAWEDLPSDLNAVFRESIDKPYTIFLKGDKYYRYENYQGRTDFGNRSITKIFRCKVNRNREPIALPLLDRH